MEKIGGRTLQLHERPTVLRFELTTPVYNRDHQLFEDYNPLITVKDEALKHSITCPPSYRRSRVATATNSIC